MSHSFKEFSSSVLSLHRYIKRSIAIVNDIGLCVLCTWLAFVLRLEELILFKDFNFYTALISIIIAIPIFWSFGLYKVIFRYTGLSIILNILAALFVYGLMYFLIIGVYGISSYTPYYANVPRSIGIIQPMTLFIAIISTRLLVKYSLIYNDNNKSFRKKNVLIYGAGEAGRQLFVSLEKKNFIESICV